MFRIPLVFSRLRPIRARIAVGLTAILLALALSGCDDGTAPTVTGEIRGIVMIEGTPMAEVMVELRGDDARDTTTDSGGRFVFEDVSAGAYVVSIRGQPVDASFSSTSRTAVIGREAGRRTVTLDFLGSFIRTSSIQGRVTARERPLENVLVRALGPDTVEARTDSEGGYAFSGLRRGDYQVEVSGFPPNVSFPRTEIRLGVETGETARADFPGTVELSASLAISGLRRILPDGTTEPVNNLDFRGTVQVDITVDRGEDTPEFVELALGDEILARQTFNPDGSPSEPILASVEALSPSAVTGEPPTAGSPLLVSFIVPSDEFNPQTGAVRFRNGPSTLRARLATREGGEDAWRSSIQITLANRDTFIGGFSPERGPVAGVDAETWVGGALQGRVVPVVYSRDRELGSVVVDFRRAGGGPLATRTLEGSGPYRPLFEASGPEGLEDYQTPRGAVDELWIRDAFYDDGVPVPGLPSMLVGSIRVDNRPPPAGRFELPEQGVDGADCCLGNWIGAAFRFPDAYRVGEDEGVGGGQVTLHAGPASLSDDALAQRPPVVRGEDLAPTSGNDAFRAVAVHRDALQNRRIVPLAPSRGNTLGEGGRGVFGVDLTQPEVRFSAASVEDRALNPPAGARWSVRAEGGPSGFAALPARSVVRRLAPGVDGPEACPFPATDLCQPAPDLLERDVPGELPGYFRIETRILDRAGNLSPALSRWVLRDEEAPEVEAVEGPSQVSPGEAFSVSAPVRDNVDLRRARMKLVLGSGTDEIAVTTVPADTLGTPFSGAPRATATARWMQHSGLVAVQEVRGPEGSPSGSILPLRRFEVEVEDAAGLTGRATQETRRRTGTSEPRGFGAEARSGPAAVAGWTLAVDGEPQVCASRDPARPGAGGDCPETLRSLTLSATATGAESDFSPGFTEVVFFAEVQGRLLWLGRVEGHDGEAAGNGTTLSWRLDWTPEAGFPTGEPVRIRALAMDGSGAGLLTAPLDGVSVEAAARAAASTNER
ncbi:MAG: carboxypeptidase regulatory-like domain-containing protein [Gemmatimonadales bacterium]|nr:MAG: carboxypeptidase regulatory-like domain-containing protein [Gemmatimonadales bacterium]